MGHDRHGPWLNIFWRNGFIGPLAHLPTTTTTTLATTMKTIIYIFNGKIVAQTTLLYPTLTNFLNLCQH